MKITLEIKENRYAAFIDYIKTLDYVSVAKEQDIPAWQKEEVFKRIELLDSGEMKSRNWDNAKSDIFRKV